MGGGERSFDVFFSYHRRDHTLVDGIAHALTKRGLRVFLDRWYLVPGQPWPQALERILASCGSVAIFLSADGLGPWQQRERDMALERQGHEAGFPVIPVLLTRADPALGFLKLNMWVDLSENVADEAALDLLCAAIRRQPLVPTAQRETADIKAAICPYRGLRTFREEDAAFFCGREAFTDKLVETVERSSLVAVVGASGIGKSSVVRAGLIPRLRERRGGRVWEIATLVPTDRPLHVLAATLVPLLEPEMSRVDRLAEINKLAGHFLDGTVTLRDVAADIVRAQPGTDRLLLFVDQWEELYTLTVDDAARRRFIGEILDASANGPVTVVFTLRGDFFGQVLSDRALADRLQGAQVNLAPMTPQELERSITEPAAKTGLKFEPGLVDRILGDVGDEPGSLPLLEFVLAALWEQRRGNVLHHDAYEQMGGVQGAIAARADAEFEKLDGAQKEAARRMLIQMVRPGEEAEDSRQRAVLPVGNEAALMVIRRLADARLVVTARDAATGAETAEVTHEALIRHWTLLRGWVDQDREFLRSKARLEAAAALWEGEKRDPSRLLPGGRPLAEGLEILASRRSDLRKSAIAFIEASSAAAAKAYRRTRLKRAAALAAAVLALAGGVVYWDLYVRVHEQYYNAYVRRWGVFEGIGPVRAGDIEHRSRTFLFARKGRLGPVVSVDAIDGSGKCSARGIPDLMGMDTTSESNDQYRLCRVTWERDSKDQIASQSMLNATGDFSGSLVYTDAEKRTAVLWGAKGHLLQMGTAATTITYERIKEGPNRGQDRFERYTDASGVPKPLFAGSFGVQAEYSPDGLLTRAVYLGADHRPMRLASGFSEVRIRWNETGSPVEYSFFDETGRPIRGWKGTARWTLTYDSHGNLVGESYFDDMGNPARNEGGYASLSRAYGPGGREIERAYFDEAGKPAVNKDGYAKLKREFDRDGRTIKEAYFDETGNPTPSKDRYASTIARYDESGRLLEEAYFDHKGKLARSVKGYAKITIAYDDRGRRTEVAYFDATGNLTPSKDGYAKHRLIYDERDNIRDDIYYDDAGQTALSNNGYAKVTRDYDGSGHPVSEAYFDEAGKQILSKEGYAKSVTTYDGQGNKATIAYFDKAGKATPIKAGYASVEFAYDVQGRIVRTSYFDKNHKPALSKDGYATRTQEYDARGKPIETAYWDEAGKPTLQKEGYAKLVKTYDRDGNERSYAYFDEAGKATVPKSGVASLILDYDARGNMVKRTFYDEKGRRSRSKDNFCESTKVYNAKGQVIEEAYFDKAGRPTAYRGYQKIMVGYDSRGNEIEYKYLDENSKPTRSDDGYARVTYAFDDRGNMIEEAYFDEAGKPTRSKKGYARLTKTFNDRGNLTKEEYLDEIGNPTRSVDGYAKVMRSYDKYGNLIETAYFDEVGKPAADKDGMVILTQTFDRRRNVVELGFFAADGKPSGVTGEVGWRAKYDDRDNAVEYAYVGSDGNVLTNRFGYAIQVSEYDALDREVVRRFLDHDRKPIMNIAGRSIVRTAYDKRGLPIEEQSFDVNDKPVNRSDEGWSVKKWQYDSNGKLLKTLLFDSAGQQM